MISRRFRDCIWLRSHSQGDHRASSRSFPNPRISGSCFPRRDRYSREILDVQFRFGIGMLDPEVPSNLLAPFNGDRPQPRDIEVTLQADPREIA